MMFIFANIAQAAWTPLLRKFASYWVAIGLVGQMLFGTRFIVQWIASERSKRSTIPISFWYLSLGGSAILLAYSIHVQDPVFIIANTFNGLIYVRNLMLIRKERATEPCRTSEGT
jgi:lipid-A-disaccharide synthase-like uncharacterized protein